MIYTCGYANYPARSLILAARDLDAIVCDIRLKPSSNKPGYSQKELRDALGNRYQHIPELGNLNHADRSAGIQLADAEAGMRRLLYSYHCRNLIVMCGCANPLTCHRHEVALLLQRRKIATQELQWPDVPSIDWNELGSTDLPDWALSVKQPWAWLLANGFKDIENRDWESSFRGRVLIHASKTVDAESWGPILRDFPRVRRAIPKLDDLDRGGVVGVVTIRDCVDESESPWWRGEYGFVVNDAKPLPFTPLQGALNFFRPSTQLVNMAAQKERKAAAGKTGKVKDEQPSLLEVA